MSLESAYHIPEQVCGLLKVHLSDAPKTPQKFMMGTCSCEVVAYQVLQATTLYVNVAGGLLEPSVEEDGEDEDEEDEDEESEHGEGGALVPMETDDDYEQGGACAQGFTSTSGVAAQGFPSTSGVAAQGSTSKIGIAAQGSTSKSSNAAQGSTSYCASAQGSSSKHSGLGASKAASCSLTKVGAYVGAYVKPLPCGHHGVSKAMKANQPQKGKKKQKKEPS